MKILVTGATGFLGRETVARLADGHEAVGAGGRAAPPGGIQCELRDAGAVRRMLSDVAPDCVVHLAAYRDPDFCEAHPEETRRLNVEPVLRMCETLPPSCRLVFISSDYVFDGESPPYREDSPRRAVNLYGRSKIDAEDLVAARPGSLIVRMPLLVGAGPTFETSGFLHQIVRDLRSGDRREADAVLRRFPTWIVDVADAIRFLVGRGDTGVVHVSGAEGLTRYDMIAQAAEILGLPMDAIAPSTRVVPRLAARPRDSQLNADRLHALGFRPLTPFRDVVRAFAGTFPAETAATPGLRLQKWNRR